MYLMLMLKDWKIETFFKKRNQKNILFKKSNKNLVE